MRSFCAAKLAGVNIQRDVFAPLTSCSRAGSIQTCFSPSKVDKPDNYRPLWYWSDSDKAVYKEWRGLRYSDCYERWGLKRTGCVGCPCNSKAEQELEIVAQYEPQLAKAARNVFGASYDYKRRYAEYKERIKAANKNFQKFTKKT
jgi:3'-phosphoadenosine 5'-phosphosulfate sulfotransferase (PAPS reductase)/FAD synthetase